MSFVANSVSETMMSTYIIWFKTHTDFELDIIIPHFPEEETEVQRLISCLRPQSW